MKSPRPTALEAWHCACCGVDDEIDYDMASAFGFRYCTICARSVQDNDDPEDLECHCGYRVDAIYCICGWPNQPTDAPSFRCEHCGERIDRI